MSIKRFTEETQSKPAVNSDPRVFSGPRARVGVNVIGPFIDAWLRVQPDDRPGASLFLQAFSGRIQAGWLGAINGVFDAEPPFTSRGCVAPAWSVAEVRRCWLKTA